MSLIEHCRHIVVLPIRMIILVSVKTAVSSEFECGGMRQGMPAHGRPFASRKTMAKFAIQYVIAMSIFGGLSEQR